MKFFKVAAILLVSLFAFAPVSEAKGGKSKSDTVQLSKQEKKALAQQEKAEKKRLKDLAKAEKKAEQERKKQEKAEAKAEKKRLKELAKSGDGGTLTLGGEGTLTLGGGSVTSVSGGTLIVGGGTLLGDWANGGFANFELIGVTEIDFGSLTLATSLGDIVNPEFVIFEPDTVSGSEFTDGVLTLVPASFSTDANALSGSPVIGLVPEPGTAALSLTALALLGLGRRRLRQGR